MHFIKNKKHSEKQQRQSKGKKRSWKGYLSVKRIIGITDKSDNRRVIKNVDFIISKIKRAWFIKITRLNKAIKSKCVKTIDIKYIKYGWII